MTKICAWCSKSMGGSRSETSSDPIISHGICEKCANELFITLGDDLKEFLDSLNEPVVVVDSDVCVKTANNQAQSFLNKKLLKIVGYKGGNVFECANATLPGGCGKTIHCSGCTIRRTITDTFQSGKSHLKVPAFLHRGIPEESLVVSMLISTEKVENVVLLRIDEVDGTEQGHA